jgi:hypothetical protein
MVPYTSLVAFQSTQGRVFGRAVHHFLHWQRLQLQDFYGWKDMMVCYGHSNYELVNFKILCSVQDTSLVVMLNVYFLYVVGQYCAFSSSFNFLV